MFDELINELISIHTLRGEGDQHGAVKRREFVQRFQSTPSVGRATRSRACQDKRQNNFNPHPPWGGRLDLLNSNLVNNVISIHTLRGEGDNSETAD